MPESHEHIAAVERVVEFIQSEYAMVSTLSLSTDLPGYTSPGRPPKLGGFVPDVFCSDTPTTMTIIGEAKTSSDLQTHRSLRQLTAFYEHLRHTPNGHLVVGVPWTEEAFTLNFLNSLRLNDPNKSAKASIVTEMRVLQCF